MTLHYLKRGRAQQERAEDSARVGAAERIERYAAIVGRERALAGTDCGFGTFAGFGAVHPDIAWARLRSLVGRARLASERLWA